MKKLYTLIALFLSMTVYAQKVEWVKNIGHSGNDQSLRCKVDNSGNILYTGTFADSIDFGKDIKLKGNGGNDAFLAKADASGNIIWARVLKSTGKGRTVDGRALATDTYGNIYVTGTFSDTLFINDQTLFGQKDQAKDIFLAKYSSDGTLTWVKVFIGPASDIAEDLEVSGNNLVLAGYYLSAITIGTSTFQSQDATDPGSNPFVANLDLNGQVQWIDKIDCKSGFCRALTISPDGKINILIEAKGSPFVRTVGTTYVAALKQSESLTADDYILQISPVDGSLVWSNRMGSIGSEMGYAIASDAASNIYIGGMFQQTVKLESTDGKYKNGLSKGGFDTFLCKYNPLGQLKWATFEGDVKTEGIRDIAVSAAGNVYVAAYFIDQTKVGNLTYTGAGIQSFLAKYSTDGIFTWAHKTSVSGSVSYFTTLCIPSGDNILVTGYFKGNATFLDNSLLSNPFETTNVWLSLINDSGIYAGISEQPGINLSVFPTPANKQLNIRIDVDQRVQRTRIFTITGNIVFDNSSGTQIIPIGNLSIGTYLLEVLTNKGRSIQRFIISR